MHLHLNPLGGLAGDMFCAALLDAFPDLLPAVRTAVACLDMPRGVTLQLETAAGPLSGKRFSVTPAEPGPHHPHHTTYRHIRELLEQAPLAPGVRSRALAVFTLLAETEGRVHGVDPQEVAFHEVGSWDSIADIVSAAALLDALDVTGTSCAPLPLGGGRIETAHGVLPVPAPATALLLQGLPVTDDGIPGERVTPTGAAIIKSLAPAAGPPGGFLAATGTGFGSRELSGLPNCLQALCITEAADTWTIPFRPETDRVATLRFEVDDQTPEDLALAQQRLRQEKGVLSVTCFQGIGKGGRPTMSIEVLARPEALSRVAEACFRETTTIGLRWQDTARLVLPRRQVRVEADGRTLGVKLVQRPGGSTAKTENRDLKTADGQGERERLRRRAESLAREADGD